MHKKLLFGLIAAIAATNAYSDQVLTSRAYVDNADAQKVNIAQGVGTNNANVGKTLVVNSSGNLELGTVSADNFVEDSITDGVTNKAPSENAVHDALENKQDTIATGMVDFVNNMGPLPAITTYDTTGGLVANKIGILDQETIADDEGALSLYYTNEYGAQMDNYVPTVRAVADGLQNIWAAMPNRLNWSSSLQTPINNYSTTFSSSSNTWQTNRQNYVPTVETFANSLALKQNKLPAQDTNLIVGQQVVQSGASSVIAPTSTPGVVQQVALWDADSQDSAAWDIDDYYGGNTVAERGAIRNSIPTVGAVELISNQIKQKQNKIPASEWEDGTIPGVVVSTDTDGVVEQRMLLDKTQNITDQSIDNVVSVGYDDGQQDGIMYDMHSNSVSANDVNNAVPTTTMTIAIAKSAANPKQNKIPAGTAGNVVTYTGTQGVVGSVATANAPTYNATTGALTNGTSIATIAAVDTKQNKMTCTRWLNNIETDENCLLWELGN